MRSSFALALLLMACSGHRPAPVEVQRHAASDLGCPRSELTFVRLNNDAYRIQGCGKETTYTYSCAQGGCEWRMDSPPRTAAPTNLQRQ